MGYRYCRNCKRGFDSSEQTNHCCPHCNSSRWTLLMPIQEKAHHAVYRAVRNGEITKTSCVVCGNPKVEGHHDDYSKPLEVVWLCKPHHKERHVQLSKEGRDPAKLIKV